MRIMARFIVPAALAVALGGPAFADAPASTRAEKSGQAADLKADSVRAMAPAKKTSASWPPNGIAVNPWIVPTFR